MDPTVRSTLAAALNRQRSDDQRHTVRSEAIDMALPATHRSMVKCRTPRPSRSLH